jgi:hypothetical protein
MVFVPSKGLYNQTYLIGGVTMANELDKMINKSLDEIDAIVDEINKGEELEVIAKAQKDQDVTPEEVSEDAPQGEESDEEVDPEQEEPGDVDSEEQEDTGEEEEEEEYEKSLEKDMKGNEGVRKALEVSEFLDELVKSMSKIIEGQRSDIVKSIESTDSSNQLLAKSFTGIAKSQKTVLETQVKLMKSMRSLTDRIGTLESQPLTRKSLSGAKAVEKSFQASAGDIPKEATLTKSMALTTLTAEFEKGNKGFINDILALESTGNFNSLSQDAKNLLKL